MTSNVRQKSTGSTDCDTVMWFIEGAGYSKVLKEACKLEIFDELINGPKSAAEIAEPKDWDADALECLLSVCASMKLVEKQQSVDGTCTFNLLNTGRQLLKNENGPPTLWGMAIDGGMSSFNPNSYEKLVRKEPEDKPDYSEYSGVWNTVPLDVFRTMDGAGRHHRNALVKFFDLSSYKQALEIGAGSGGLGIALCRNYPDMHVVLLDGEATLQKAREHFVPKELADRISYLPGDVLEVDLPKVDLFVTSQVLHIIPKDKVDSLLTKLRDHLNPGGAVLFTEAIVNENKDGPLLNMLRLGPDTAQYKNAATPQSYIKLMEKNGFKDVQIIQTQEMSFYDVVFAKKP